MCIRDRIAVAPNAAFIAECLGQCLTQGNAHIFDRVMVINVQISGAAHCHVHQSMTRQLIEHVVEKADAGLIVIEAAAIEIELDLDFGLCGIAGNVYFAHCLPFMFRGLIICLRAVEKGQALQVLHCLVMARYFWQKRRHYRYGSAHVRM